MLGYRWSRLPRCLCRLHKISYSTTTVGADKSVHVAPTLIRTNEDNTSAHTDVHLAKFYTITPEVKKQLFGGGGLPRAFEKQVKTFAEMSLMIRSPALELIKFTQQAVAVDRPVTRFVLYGDNGSGKTLTMAHVLHYGLQSGFLLLHVPWVPNWMKRPKEIANSSTKEGFIDLPFDAAAWLVHFKTQNAKLLPTLNLTTSKDYVWSKREVTPKGSPISGLVEHGITRIKFACETVAALLSELKEHASSGRCKVMVAIDGFNAFFHPETRIFGDNKQIIPPDRITLTQPFVDITEYNWTNGICILTVDKLGMTEGYMDSYMPRYLLGQWGFEHLDPFVPVHVSNYNEKEFASCIEYYLDRHWIQKKPKGFEDQLKYMSNKNPYILMQLTRSL